MTRQETRIVMLSMAVTLLGGWATTVEAVGARAPTCEDRVFVVETGSCPSYFAQYTRCNAGAGNCVYAPTTCYDAPGDGYTLTCVGSEIEIP